MQGDSILTRGVVPARAGTWLNPLLLKVAEAGHQSCESRNTTSPQVLSTAALPDREQPAEAGAVLRKASTRKKENGRTHSGE